MVVLRDLDNLVQRSNFLGKDQDLVVHGGGNTSAKGRAADHLGRDRAVLWVKGSGADMASALSSDFPGLWLDEVLPLRQRAALSDEDMTAYLRHVMVDPDARRPSIETLLHAFLPYRHVDHVHADAIVALTKARAGAETVREALGERVAYVEWVRPGFELSKRVADLAGYQAVVLAHHGLVTWGDDSDTCLESTRRHVARAERYLAHRPRGRVEAAARDLPDAEVERLLLALRGAVGRRAARVLHVDSRLRPIADRADVDRVAAAGVASADHMLHMRPWPAVARSADEAGKVVATYEGRYRELFERHRHRGPDGLTMHDPAPLAVLVPGLGAVTAGRDRRAAQVVADVLWHSSRVAALALDRFGAVEPLPEADVFDVDYWPMELYKLRLRPEPPPLAGRVFVVTGAASGIGRTVARALAAGGASLVLGDIDGAGLAAVADEIAGTSAAGPEVLAGDLEDEAVVTAMVAAGIRRYGGLDGFVASAGVAAAAPLSELSGKAWERTLGVNLTSAFTLTRAALQALAAQGTGGSLVYIASKNAFGPGAGFGAYSVSKAAMVQLARIAAIEGGPLGIRANVVNPDAVFDGSRLWSEQLRKERAAAHGVAPEDLESFYARRNLLQARVTTADVAEAVMFLLSERSARTTGCVLTVDGGVAAAFPR